ncbi:MAG: DsrE family protein [Alphaproteobacteria bacterium]|nr:DsrE family protein [Alphaproteobacteria bacterium]
MKKSMAAIVIALAGLFAIAGGLPAMAEGKTHYLAIHVDENDKGKMTIVLNNAGNVIKYYEAKGDKVEVEIVAHGPGLHMYREDTSPVKGRIAAMSLENENLKFSACGNTIKGMTKKEGKAPTLISEATVVPSGVVRLMELQEQGWTYVRP